MLASMKSRASTRNAVGWVSPAMLWLSIGAILNVAFTWGVLLTSSEIAFPTTTKKEVPWPVEVPAHWPKQALSTTTEHRWIKDSSAYHYYGKEIRVTDTNIRSERGTVLLDDAGWPMRALRGWSMFGRPDIGHIHRFEFKGRDLDPGSVYLPWLPLWPGFALNTLFYAAIAWGLWQVPLAIRRRRRRRLNRCGKCGYDRAGLAGDAACPECGATSAACPRAKFS